jgi:hypothetical protein
LYLEALMLDRTSSAKVLRNLFHRTLVADIGDLFRILETQSRMSVFRRLNEVGYRSSYTHSGRYYTLTDIPRFNERGLWFRQDVGFSQAGTLKATLVALVDSEPLGCTHEELEGLLHLRVHNTLLDLVREKRVVREPFEGAYLYVSPSPGLATAQKEKRQEALKGRRAPASLSTTTVIEVLAEALQAGRVRVSAALVAARLQARGLRVAVEQVTEVLARYGVETGKKTAQGSKRSKG